MASKDIAMAAEGRQTAGSIASRRLRRAGLVPGIVNTPRGDSHLIQMNRHDFEVMLHHHKSENLLVDLRVGGAESRRVLLKEVQHDPLSSEVLHVDFLEVSMTTRMRFRIPVKLVGVPPGAEAGGILEHLLREVEVECLPGDLVEQIEVDVSGLNVGDSLLARDVKLDPTLTLVTLPEVAVAAVVMPRAVTEEEAEKPAEVEAAEPEVIGEKKKEEREKEKAEAAAAEKEGSEK